MATEQWAVVILLVILLVISLLKLKLWLRLSQSRAEKQNRLGPQPRSNTYEQRDHRERQKALAN